MAGRQRRVGGKPVPGNAAAHRAAPWISRYSRRMLARGRSVRGALRSAANLPNPPVNARRREGNLPASPISTYLSATVRTIRSPISTSPQSPREPLNRAPKASLVPMPSPLFRPKLSSTLPRRGDKEFTNPLPTDASALKEQTRHGCSGSLGRFRRCHPSRTRSSVIGQRP